MTEDEVLAAVRDEARKQRTRAADLESVARGAASADELTALEEQAKSDPELALALEAAQPLGEDATARIADRVAGSPEELAREAPEELAPEELAREAPEELAPEAPEELPLPAADAPTPLRRRMIQFAGPLALAAVMLIYMSTRSSPVTGPELPAYSVTAAGDQAMRGPAENTAPSASSVKPMLVLRGAPSARYEIALRPATAASARVAAYAFVVRGGDVASIDDAKVDVSNEGAVRIIGAARDLEGATAVRVVVGASDAVGKFDYALDRARAQTSDARLRVFDVPIVRESAGRPQTGESADPRSGRPQTGESADPRSGRPQTGESADPRPQTDP